MNIKKVYESARRIHRRFKKNRMYTDLYIFVLAISRKILIVLGLRQKNSADKQTRFYNAFAEAYENDAIVEKTVLYESFHGSRAACNPKAIFDVLINHPEYKEFHHIWVIDNQDVVPKSIGNNDRVTVIKRTSLKYPRHLATAKYLFNNSTFPPWYIRRENQVYVNTWHGIPLKTMFKDENGPKGGYANSQRNFLQASHIVLSSNYTAEKLLGSADVLPLVSTKTYLTGSARLDTSISKRKSFETDKAEQQVLYAPTWKGSFGSITSQVDEVESVISEISNHPNSNFRIFYKLHNFNKKDDAVLSKRFEGQIGTSIFPMGSHEDINEKLADVDVLVTDYSSIAFDAISCDIPVVLFVADRKEYSAKRGLYLDLDTLPVTVCETLDTLAEAVAGAVRPSQMDLQKYEETIETIVGVEDGLASSRIIDVIFKDSDSVKPIDDERKPILAFYGGGWRQNGISNSMLNLLNNLDKEQYTVALLTDGSALKDEAWDLLDELEPEILKIHNAGKEGFTKDESPIKTHFYKYNQFDNQRDREVMYRLMTREWRRMMGDTYVHASVDFSGYRRLWTWRMAAANAYRKIVFQHNDLHSEMTIKFPILEGVFVTYEHFDVIASVSEETKNLNLRSLGNFYDSGKAISIRNTLNIGELEKISKSIELIQRNDQSYLKLEEKVTNRGEGVSTIDLIRAPSDDTINFVCLGRFSDEKNHALLLKAFAIAKQKRSDLRLAIFGEGPLYQKTVALRDHLDLNDSVILPGFSKYAKNYLQKSDCLVLPSKYEGQPMVILEALVLNKPVITTNIDGSRSALDGGYGYIVDKNTPEVFAQALIDFAEDRLGFKPFDGQAYNNAALQDFYDKIQ